MFGRTGRVIHVWDGNQWNHAALWNQESRFGSVKYYDDARESHADDGFGVREKNNTIFSYHYFSLINFCAGG